MASATAGENLTLADPDPDLSSLTLMSIEAFLANSSLSAFTCASEATSLSAWLFSCRAILSTRPFNSATLCLCAAAAVPSDFPSPAPPPDAVTPSSALSKSSCFSSVIALGKFNAHCS